MPAQPKGPASARWRGPTVSPATGRQRAQDAFPLRPGQVCAECEDHPARIRHHWNEDTNDNTPANIVWLCDRCHRRLHWKLTCLRGHPLSGDNLYVWTKGGVITRRCRICHLEAKQRYRERHRR